METNDFAWGFVAGLVAAGVVAWFWSLYRGWIKERDAFRKPQPVIQMTRKTPAEVASEAASAQTKIGCAWLVLILLVWLAIELLMPGLAVAIRNLIGNLLFGG